jgi:hypothetical protein
MNTPNGITILTVTHSDLMRPIRIPSKSGFRWIMTYLCEQIIYSY